MTNDDINGIGRSVSECVKTTNQSQADLLFSLLSVSFEDTLTTLPQSIVCEDRTLYRVEVTRIPPLKLSSQNCTSTVFFTCEKGKK